MIRFRSLRFCKSFTARLALRHALSTWFKIDLTDAEIAVVLEGRHSHPNRSIRERMNVVWMLHNGTKREEAAKLANVS